MRWKSLTEMVGSAYLMTMIINFIRRAAVAVSFSALFVLGAAACGEDDPAPATSSAKLDQTKAKLVVANYAANVYASYSDVVTKTTALEVAVDAFVATPTDATLAAAKQAWLDARPLYGQTEGFRFYDGPIDNADTGPEGRINGWPLDENYIDYVSGDASSGIVNETTKFPTIDASVIAAANEIGGEKNLSAGWHAIEFLLWGQDKSATGPGERPTSDYQDTDGNPSPNPARRAAYLKAVTQLLLEDLTTVKKAWEPGVAGNYRATFEAQDPAISIAAIMKGIGTLASAELPQERMNVALTSKEQEDEHSCFSDNTNVDIQANALSIQNIWLGKYGNNDGPGLDELVALADAAQAQKTTALIAESVEHCNEIPKPFDQVIISADDAPARVNAKHAVEELISAGGAIVESAGSLGLAITAKLE